MKDIKPQLKLLVVILVLAGLFYSKDIVIISLIGLGIGILLSPLLDLFQKWLRLRRSYATLLLVVAIVLFIVIVGGLFGWVIAEQASSLIAGLPDFASKTRVKLESLFERFPWMLEQVKNYDVAGALQNIANYFLKGAQAGSVAIGGLIFSLILGIYLAVDGQFYYNGAVRSFPPQHRKRAHDLLGKCARVIRVWFRAQLLDMAIIGLITAFGLWIIGVQYWALLGLLTAILGIIPYVGIMIVVGLVSVITLASDASDLPWVLLVFFVTQQIEGNVILPLVMKGQAEIPEALLIVVMLFFGYWFGLLGILIAPPVVAVMICLYRNLYLPAIEKNSSRHTANVIGS